MSKTTVLIFFFITNAAYAQQYYTETSSLLDLKLIYNSIAGNNVIVDSVVDMDTNLRPEDCAVLANSHVGYVDAYGFVAWPKNTSLRVRNDACDRLLGIASSAGVQVPVVAGSMPPMFEHEAGIQCVVHNMQLQPPPTFAQLHDVGGLSDCQANLTRCPWPSLDLLGAADNTFVGQGVRPPQFQRELRSVGQINVTLDSAYVDVVNATGYDVSIGIQFNTSATDYQSADAFVALTHLQSGLDIFELQNAPLARDFYHFAIDNVVYYMRFQLKTTLATLLSQLPLVLTFSFYNIYAGDSVHITSVEVRGCVASCPCQFTHPQSNLVLVDVLPYVCHGDYLGHSNHIWNNQTLIVPSEFSNSSSLYPYANPADLYYVSFRFMFPQQADISVLGVSGIYLNAPVTSQQGIVEFSVNTNLTAVWQRPYLNIGGPTPVNVQHFQVGVVGITQGVCRAPAGATRSLLTQKLVEPVILPATVPVVAGVQLSVLTNMNMACAQFVRTVIEWQWAGHTPSSLQWQDNYLHVQQQTVDTDAGQVSWTRSSQLWNATLIYAGQEFPANITRNWPNYVPTACEPGKPNTHLRIDFILQTSTSVDDMVQDCFDGTRCQPCPVYSFQELTRIESTPNVVIIPYPWPHPELVLQVSPVSTVPEIVQTYAQFQNQIFLDVEENTTVFLAPGTAQITNHTALVRTGNGYCPSQTTLTPNKRTIIQTNSSQITLSGKFANGAIRPALSWLTKLPSYDDLKDESVHYWDSNGMDYIIWQIYQGTEPLLYPDTGFYPYIDINAKFVNPSDGRYPAFVPGDFYLSCNDETFFSGLPQAPPNQMSFTVNSAVSSATGFSNTGPLQVSCSVTIPQECRKPGTPIFFTVPVQILNFRYTSLGYNAEQFARSYDSGQCINPAQSPQCQAENFLVDNPELPNVLMNVDFLYRSKLHDCEYHLAVLFSSNGWTTFIPPASLYPPSAYITVSRLDGVCNCFSRICQVYNYNQQNHWGWPWGPGNPPRPYSTKDISPRFCYNPRHESQVPAFHAWFADSAQVQMYNLIYDMFGIKIALNIFSVYIFFFCKNTISIFFQSKNIKPKNACLQGCSLLYCLVACSHVYIPVVCNYC